MKRQSVKLAFVEVDDPWEKSYLKSHLKEYKNVTFHRGTVEEEIKGIQDADILSVFIKSKVSNSILKKLKKVKLIATRSTGFDHIDVKTAKTKKTKVANVPTYGENTVAEHAFALMLSLSRNMRKAYWQTSQNNFSLKGLMGFDLMGKTLGILGTGHIGLHAIRTGVAFGMKVIAYDVKQNHFLADVLNYQYVSLDELFKRADIISLHLPLLPSTRHIINKAAIKKMKKGVILINTARGGLIDTDALIQGLDQEKIGGAGLDVLEDEEWVWEERRLLQAEEIEKEWIKLRNTHRNHVLLHKPNVIYTPHMAFYSREAVQRILDTTLENISAYLNNKPLNCVS